MPLMAYAFLHKHGDRAANRCLRARSESWRQFRAVARLARDTGTAATVDDFLLLLVGLARPGLAARARRMGIALPSRPTTPDVDAAVAVGRPTVYE